MRISTTAGGAAAAAAAATDEDATNTVEQDLPRLTENMLKIHDKKIAKSKNNKSKPNNNNNNNNASNKNNNKKNKQKTIQHQLVRKQFNCPVCPSEGRGNFVFFKRVPATKPVVKCPQCKKVKKGGTTTGLCRLYPVAGPAKGYGLFKCPVCLDKWGSSRAVEDVAQGCHSCHDKFNGKETMVKPFRMEVYRKNQNSSSRQRTSTGPYNRRRRQNQQPAAIKEDREAVVDSPLMTYTQRDQARHQTGAGNALLQTPGGGYSYDGDNNNNLSSASSCETYVDFGSDYFQSSDDDSNEWQIIANKKKTIIPVGYSHKCAACTTTGQCQNRRIVMSMLQDTSDGNTVSTSASVLTNSSVDKSDFVDRDEDFSGFDDQWKPE